MATNSILTFCASGVENTDFLSDANYSIDSQRGNGNQPGIARLELVNKALRQLSLMSSGLAQFMANNQVNDIIDTESVANIASYLELAIGSIAGAVASTAEAQAWTENTKKITPLRLAEAFKGANQTLAATGKQNLPGGLMFKWDYATTSITGDTGIDITFPTAFPNACFAIFPSFIVANDQDDSGPAYRNLTASGFRLTNSLTTGGGSAAPVGYSYFAIGH